MIEIGADPAAIAATFGYAPEQIEAVVQSRIKPDGGIPA
jgi:hypothetical protein